jgi:hypothetical protein
MSSQTDFMRIMEAPVAAHEEGLRFFRGEGMVNETLRRLAEDLAAHGIDYSVIGAVALNQHGYRRFTEDIDLLLTPEGLESFCAEPIGHGYRPAFQGATRKFRETERNVPIQIINVWRVSGRWEAKVCSFPPSR